MYQIINNAQTLNELMGGVSNGLFWFVSAVVGAPTSEAGTYTLQTQLLWQGTVPQGYQIYPYLSNCPALIDIISTNPSIATKMENLTSEILSLFQFAVPYNQNMYNATVGEDLPNSTGTTQSYPVVLQQIASYFGMYKNDILLYLLRSVRLEQQMKMVQQQMSKQRTRTQGVDTNFKDSANSTSAHINTTSFNPVAESTKITTQPINVATPSAPGMDNTVSATTTSNTNTSEATYSTLTTGNNSNSLQNTQQNLTESETYQNIQMYNEVGQNDFKVALRPLIKKIARLFMQLGNNYHQDITPLNVKGLNVW